MIFVYQFLFLAITYFVCAIPFGLVITKACLGKDVREAGSGNIGATNVTRIAGKKLGLITLLLDGFKGAIMVIVARFSFYFINNLHLFLAIVSIVAVIAHIYPVYLKFKGGKGVATALAVLLALDPIVGFLSIVFWLMIFLIYRISSVASLIAVLSSIAFSVHYDAPTSQVVLCCALFVVIAARHRENVIRLLLGEEKKM